MYAKSHEQDTFTGSLPILMVLISLQTVRCLTHSFESALKIVVCLTSNAEPPRPNLCFMQQYGRQDCCSDQQLLPWLRSQQLAGC